MLPILRSCPGNRGRRPGASAICRATSFSFWPSADRTAPGRPVTGGQASARGRPRNARSRENLRPKLVASSPTAIGMRNPAWKLYATSFRMYLNVVSAGNVASTATGYVAVTRKVATSDIQNRGLGVSSMVFCDRRLLIRRHPLSFEPHRAPSRIRAWQGRARAHALLQVVFFEDTRGPCWGPAINRIAIR